MTQGSDTMSLSQRPPRSTQGAGDLRHSSPSADVAVNTPPSGGPTSSPKTSVTPSFSSPTWSAMRTACTTVAMAQLSPPT